jgi:lactate oxidase
MDAQRRLFLSAAGAAAAVGATRPLLAQAAGPQNFQLADAAPAVSTAAAGLQPPPGAVLPSPASAGPASSAVETDLPTVTVPGYDAPRETRKIVVRNLRALEEPAGKIIPTGGFGYISSGAGDEWTMHENIAAFKRRQIVPQYLTGHSDVDTSTSILGTKISYPVITTVFGGHAIAHVTAEAGTAKGTHAVGTIFTCGSQANLSMEVVAKASPGPRWMQLYFRNDPGLMREFLQRAKASGYTAIVLTTDAFFPSNRETDVAGHYESPFPAANFPAAKVTGYSASTATMKRNLGWDDVGFIQRESGLPVIVKGVMSPIVAAEAVRQGCAAIQISNHGGRQLDDQPATFTMLPQIADAVGGRIPIIFDSGVRRGQDVFKALALGANVVALGRPILYGLALGGWMGVQSVHEKLAAEFRMTMMAAGTASIADIKPDRLLA